MVSNGNKKNKSVKEKKDTVVDDNTFKEVMDKMMKKYSGTLSYLAKR